MEVFSFESDKRNVIVMRKFKLNDLYVLIAFCDVIV
jgi:hypothetical protein